MKGRREKFAGVPDCRLKKSGGKSQSNFPLSDWRRTGEKAARAFLCGRRRSLTLSAYPRLRAQGILLFQKSRAAFQTSNKNSFAVRSCFFIFAMFLFLSFCCFSACLFPPLSHMFPLSIPRFPPPAPAHFLFFPEKNCAFFVKLRALLPQDRRICYTVKNPYVIELCFAITKIPFWNCSKKDPSSPKENTG